MKGLTIGVFSFFLSNLILAQPFQEIKLNTFGFVMDQVSISYEHQIKKGFGIEVGLGYNYEPQTLLLWNNTNIPPSIPNSESYKKNYWVIMLHSKFYPFKKENGDGFNLGGYFHFQSKPNVESTYFTAYEQFYNEPIPFSFNANYILGGFAGYKFLILQQKMVIEPIYGIGVSMSNSDFDVGGFGFELTGFLQINLGYRF